MYDIGCTISSNTRPHHGYHSVYILFNYPVNTVERFINSSRCFRVIYLMWDAIFHLVIPKRYPVSQFESNFPHKVDESCSLVVVQMKGFCKCTNSCPSPHPTLYFNSLHNSTSQRHRVSLEYFIICIHITISAVLVLVVFSFSCIGIAELQSQKCYASFVFVVRKEDAIFN